MTLKNKLNTPPPDVQNLFFSGEAAHLMRFMLSAKRIEHFVTVVCDGNHNIWRISSPAQFLQALLFPGLAALTRKLWRSTWQTVSFDRAIRPSPGEANTDFTRLLDA